MAGWGTGARAAAMGAACWWPSGCSPRPERLPTQRQQALLDHLDAHGPKPVTQLVEQGFGRALLKNLATKQWISLTPTVLKGEAALAQQPR